MNDALNILTTAFLLLVAIVLIWVVLRIAGRAFARGWIEEMRRKKEDREDGEEKE